MMAKSEGLGQTAGETIVNMQPGETQTVKWGLISIKEETIQVSLRAEGEGKELLTFPETLDLFPNEWTFIDITISIPEDHPNDVKLEPAVFALDEGKKGGGMSFNVQMMRVVTILIGNPVIAEESETVEEVEETPTAITEEEEAPGEFILQTEEEPEGGGCLISTATFGSELAPQVQMLREIRDNKLLSTESGSAFMSGFNSLYYSFSPTVADLERQSPIFKEAVKLTLTPLITSLSILNYVDMDSEAKVLGYGISLILLNIGMYFVAPAFLITRLRR